jgi:ankyrin repeat protein
MNGKLPLPPFAFTRRGALAASLFAAAGLPAFAAGSGGDEGGEVDGRAFRRAVAAGEVDKVRDFLGRDPALIYSRDEKGVSVTIIAFLAGHPEVVALFRERGLQLDLVEASMAADWERVKELLEPAPGQVHQLHPFGGTALHAAALLGHGEKLFELQAFGADANANPPGGRGMTPLRLAFEGRDPRKVEVTVAGLLGNGADPNAKQKDGDQPLHAAARAKSAYLVKVLLRKGADPAARNERGETALAIAEAAADAATVAVLRHPEKVRRDHRSTRFAPSATGVAYAPPAIDLPQLRINRLVGAAHGNFDLVKEWVGQHPELAFAISTLGEMSIEAAAHVGRKDLVAFFLERGLPQSLPTSLTAGDLERAKKLLAEDPKCIDERGPHDLPLTLYPSFVGGDLAAAALLVEKGVDVHAEKLGVTALHVAARMGQVELAELWLKAGADPRAKTRDEGASTPLDFARKQGHAAVVTLLEKAG